jgi:serine/threonine-protein kinase
MSSNLLTEDIILPPGEVIDGKYEILGKIGQGGMGVVYKARSVGIDRENAIKMLTHVDDETLKRFHREASILGSINHRAVMRVDDFGDSGKWGPYLAMEYVLGRDLGDLVKQQPLPIQEAVDLTIAICTGVHACHSQAIIHRDLKPSNIRVTNKTEWQDRIKILDFGLALPFDSPILKAYETRITHGGAVRGTPRYIAPELLLRQPPTKQADQYGIASLLYLLLTGRAPFHDLEGEGLFRAIVNGAYVPVHFLRPDTPPSLQTAISRGLHVDPSQRFPSVDSFAMEIISAASPHLQRMGTRYFLDARRPLDRRLIEPVSSYHPSGFTERKAPSPTIVAPMLVEAPPRPAVSRPTPISLFSPPPPALDRPERRIQTPLPGPAGTSSPRRHRERRSDFKLFLIFTSGAALGAAIAVGAFIAFLAYQRNAAFCQQPGPQSAAFHEQPVDQHGSAKP